MKQYLDLLQDLLDNGVQSTDRTGVGTLRKAGHMMRFNLADGFPLVTSKKVHIKSVVHELLFFLSGNTNQGYLLENGVTIWREWGDANGNLGPIYSHQWRNFGGSHRNRPQPTPKSKRSSEGYVKGADAIEDKLFSTWSGMLARCYAKTKDQYAYYGGKGVFVCDDWFSFSKFSEDVKNLIGWENKKDNWTGYQLDKDIRGDGFCYSPDHCIWASKQENMRMKYTTVYILQHDDGRVETTAQPIDFYTRHNISQGNFCQMLKGVRRKAGGWSLLDSQDVRKGFDQISWAVNQLKQDPDSRRITVTAWNPEDIEFMALAPCHCLFQLLVIDGKLNLEIYQRSCDSFIGLPFNLASYALLCHMFAQQAGLEVGDLIWVGGDVHLYLNHIEQAKLQLSREPRPLPTLVLNKAASMFDYRYEDIRIRNYDPWPAIAAPIAV